MIMPIPCDVTNLGSGSPNQQADTYANLLDSAGILRARTSEGPPNSLEWARNAPYRLQALAFGYDTTNESGITGYIAEAMHAGRWAIIVFHEIGIGEAGAGIIPPNTHEELLSDILKLGVHCGTVQSAIDHAGIEFG